MHADRWSGRPWLRWTRSLTSRSPTELKGSKFIAWNREQTYSRWAGRQLRPGQALNSTFSKGILRIHALCRTHTNHHMAQSPSGLVSTTKPEASANCCTPTGETNIPADKHRELRMRRTHEHPPIASNFYCLIQIWVHGHKPICRGAQITFALSSARSNEARAHKPPYTATSCGEMTSR